MKTTHIAFLITLAACDTDLPGYILKQGLHQGSMILRSEKIERVLSQPGLDPKTAEYLTLTRDVLAFARTDLGMSTGSNYQRYLHLERDWVTQIVMAAKKDKLEPYLFQYPVVGALPYKGFFDEVEAKALEESLKAEGLDTYRRKVEAYSTTGWLPDPVISTMFSSRARFVELLFHELTHSTFYFKSQADFNEAFASWMGFRGALEFIKNKSGMESVVQELKEGHERSMRLAKIIKEILDQAPHYFGQSDPLKGREEYFDWIRMRFSQEKGFEKFAKLPWNNALILSFGTYYQWVGPIDTYAAEHKLSPKEFLRKVRDQGPSVISEILPLSK